MRHLCSVILAAVALSNCGLGYGQVAGPAVVTRPATLASTDTPLFEVYQAIFSILFSGPAPRYSNEARASAAEKLEAAGLDREAAWSLASYVSDGLAQQRDLTETKVVQLCTRKATLTSKAQVGDAFVAIDDDLNRMQERLWGTLDFLDSKNKAILSSYAAKRALELQVLSRIDPHTAFERSSETLQQLLDRICAGK
jgi:hypothetical protein